MSDIQKRIKELRLKNGYTLAQLADLLSVKEATVQRYESGEIKNIKHHTIVKLAAILKCSPAYLMGWEEYPFQLKEIAERKIEERKSMTPIENLNIRLVQAMEQKNIEILELSQKTGIAENVLSQYLSGHTHPSKDNMYLISKILEVSQDWLMGYDVPMEAKYYSKNYELSAEEEAIIAIFRNLTKSGQDRLLEYSMELIEISKYKLKK